MSDHKVGDGEGREQDGSGKDSAAQRSEGTERRGGRRRRPWRALRRIVLWTLALVALVFLQLVLFLESPRAEAWARQALVRFLEARLEREVGIERLDLDPLVLAAQAEGVRIGGPDPDDRPVLEADLVGIDLRLVDLALFGDRPTRLRLQALDLDRPVLVYERRPDGSDNLPRWHGAGDRQPRQGPSRLELEIGGIDVDAGRVVVNEREVPLEVDLLGVDLALVGLGGVEAQGDLAVELVRLLLPDARPVETGVRARVRMDDAGVRVERAELLGPHHDVDARVEVAFPAPDRPSRVEVAVDAELGGGLVESLGLAESAPEGDVRLIGDFVWQAAGETAAPVREAAAPEDVEGAPAPSAPTAEAIAGAAAELPAGSWRLDGTLFSDRLAWGGLELTGLEAQLTGDARGTTLQLEGARLAGGLVRGRLELDREPPVEGPATWPNRLELELERVDVDTLLEVLDTPVDPVASTLSGSLAYGFRTDAVLDGSGVAELEVEPVPAADGRPRGRPVRGRLPLVIADGRVSSEALRLRLPSQEVVGSFEADLDELSGRFQLTLSSDDLASLVGLLELDTVVAATEAQAAAAADREEPLVLIERGRGSATGRFRFDRERLTGEVAFELFDTAARVAGLELAFDDATGSFRLGPDLLDQLTAEGELGDAVVRLQGELPWSEGAAGPELDLELERWPIERLLPAAGVVGRLSGRGRLDPATGASAALEVAELAWQETALGDARAAVTWHEERLELDGLVLELPAGRIEGDATVDLAQERLRLDVAADRLDLDAPPFAAVLGGNLGTSARLDVSLDGPLRRPEGRLRLETTTAALGTAGPANLVIDWDGRRLEARGGIPGLVRVDGGGRLDLEGADLEIRLDEIDLGAVAEVVATFGAPPEAADAQTESAETEEGPTASEQTELASWLDDVAGEASGRLLLEADWLRPAAPPGALPSALVDDEPAPPYTLDALLELDHFVASFQDRPIRAVEPIRLRWQDGGVLIESLYLEGPAGPSELIAFGRVGVLEPGVPLDLRIDGNVGLHWIEETMPEFRTSGQFDFLVAVRGTLDEPDISGQGGVRRGRFAWEEFPHAFEAVDLLVFFYPDRLVLDRLRARVAEGSILAYGQMQWPGGDEAFPSLELQARVERVELRYPEDWRIAGSADLSFRQSSGGERQLVGQVRLEQAEYVAEVSLSLGAMLRAMTARERVQVSAIDQRLDTVRINLAVQGENALRMDNDLIQATGDIDLDLTGTLARPILFGEVSLDSGSTVDWGGEKYQITQGLLTFADPFENNPMIDVTARTRRREYEIILNLSGRTDRLEANLSSEPPLPDLDVLSLVSGGGLPTDGGLAPSAGSGSVSARDLLYGQATSLVEGRIESLFGLDRFRLDPLRSGDSLSSARVTIGKQLSRDLFVTYSIDPSSTDESVVEVEWRLTDRIVLVLSQNSDGSYAVDVRVEQSF